MTLQPLETISESLSSSHINTSLDDNEPDVYTIIKISDKGMGMVANTDIPPGKLIIEEKPLFSVPLTASGDLPGRVRSKQPKQALLNVRHNFIYQRLYYIG